MQTLDSSKSCTAQFADQHIHGLAGVDFATSTTSDIRAALALLAARRTTQVTASIPTVQQQQVPAILARLGPLFHEGLLSGIHFEGPFLAPAYAGAHSRQALLAPGELAGQNFLATVLKHQELAPMITMMTVAPELVGFEALVQQLVAYGIAPALGHTNAAYEQMRDGIDLVFQLTGRPVIITHLYNAMRGFHHREPGPLLAVIEAAQRGMVSIELIADGHHVHAGVISWWLTTYPTAVRLVSDASAATLPSGCKPLTQSTPMLGLTSLGYPSSGSPMLADGYTRASGASDLATIHDDLVAHGLDHAAVCAAMRSH